MGWKVKSVAAGGTLQVKASPGILHSLTVAYTDDASQVVKVYDAPTAANLIIDLPFRAAGLAGQTVDSDTMILNWQMEAGIFLDASTIGAGGYVVAAYG